MTYFMKFVWKVLVSTVISIIASMTKRKIMKHVGV